MKLAKILDVLSNDPLLCAAEYRSSLLEMFRQHADLSPADFRAQRTGMAKSGQELNIRQMEIEDGIARIPVGGPIGQGLGEFEKGAGAVDVDDIRDEIDEAQSDDTVEAIVLDFDSPGGMVTGTPELANYIAESSESGKPLYAFCRGCMASAAYWLACACDGIFCTPSATVGSIGVCMVFNDLSRAADMAGVRVKVFASGPVKGAGTPGTSLTADQEMFLRGRVAELADNFYSHVRANRPDVSDADMQGQHFTGTTALAKGLVDDVMEYEDLVAFLKAV
jgi:signal peptide peptidase SppA